MPEYIVCELPPDKLLEKLFRGRNRFIISGFPQHGLQLEEYLLRRAFAEVQTWRYAGGTNTGWYITACRIVR